MHKRKKPVKAWAVVNRRGEILVLSGVPPLRQYKKDVEQYLSRGFHPTWVPCRVLISLAPAKEGRKS